jgi:hypothetical protein
MIFMKIEKARDYSVGAACLVDKIAERGVKVECGNETFGVRFRQPELAEVEMQNGAKVQVMRLDKYTNYKCSCLAENCIHIKAVRKFMGFNI